MFEDLSVLFPQLAGVLLALIFAYVPGVDAWFAKLDGIGKRIVLLVLLALVSAGYVALACSPFGAQYGVSADVCTSSGFADVVRAFIAAVIANQATYLVATPSNKII